MLSKKHIIDLLENVKDPEIPVLSLIDLGVITTIAIENNKVIIEMTPTFVGCPAIDVMKENVEHVLKKNGIEQYDVIISFEKPWSSNLITEKGKEALKKFGLAPPPSHQNLIVDIDLISHVKCPYCDSDNTEMKSLFGPTLCRSLHYCNNCQQAFEQFKPI